MWADIEFFDGGVIRIFEDGAEFGTDPYVNAVPFKVLSHDPLMIEFKGVVKPLSPAQVRAMKKALRARQASAMRLRICGAKPGVKVFR